MTRRVCAVAVILVAGTVSRAYGADNIVLYASDVTVVRGNWSAAATTGGAGAQAMTSVDNGWSATSTALASPTDYFEATFTADANTSYHVWLRLRAAGNSKWNDSVYVQFGDATDVNGSAVYRTGTTDGLLVNLENCNGCGDAGWGWQDRAWWTGQSAVVKFPSTGAHTLRVQTREDGVQVDQIVLSPSTYLSSAPGAVLNDNTIVQKPSVSVASVPVSSTGAYSGTPASIPGTIQAVNFDNGGEGVAYHDTDTVNSGGAYRSTGVDIEPMSGGGYDVGWIASGEWLNYTVNVTAAGSYTAQLRVASLNGGGSMHLGFNGASNVWTAVSIPRTGGWQTWTTVNVPVTLGAGKQQMTLGFDVGGFNVSSINVVSTATPSVSPPVSSSLAYSGSPAPIPGTIQAENFDTGGPGVSYGDSTPGNSGGAYRQTDVDIEATAGGYNVGWIAAGEWLNYTVNVSSAGNYTAQLRVASPSGAGSLHLGFNGPSHVWSVVTIPSTGGWQTWSTVNVPVTLGAGTQTMTLAFDTAGFNLDWINVVAGSVAPPPPPPPPPPPAPSTGKLRMMTWNIRSGTSANNTYTLPSQVQFMASQNADVIVLQEVSTWNNQYQPTIIRDQLQQITGQTWYYYAIAGSQCATGGCIVEEILSRYPLGNPQTQVLYPSAVGHAQITVGGVPIEIFTCHLDYYNTSIRTTELNGLMSWARGYAGPRLVGGDFNSWWGEWWIGQMRTEYSDTWLDFSGQQDGAYTTSNVRFDYIFRSFDGAWRLTPTNAFVPYSDLSDHRPFVADFKIQ